MRFAVSCAIRKVHNFYQSGLLTLKSLSFCHALLSCALLCQGQERPQRASSLSCFHLPLLSRIAGSSSPLSMLSKRVNTVLLVSAMGYVFRHRMVSGDADQCDAFRVEGLLRSLFNDCKSNIGGRIYGGDAYSMLSVTMLDVEHLYNEYDAIA